MLAVGTQAPEFELHASPEEKIKLSELKGKKVILAFYPADWSPVCSDELTIFNHALRLFSKHNAQLLGISVDSKWSHMAFKDKNNFKFPLLADFEPKGSVANLYEAYDKKEGHSTRALYVIDEQGVIQWAFESPIDINPGADGILEALEVLDKK
jgi:peroxiredoxin